MADSDANHVAPRPPPSENLNMDAGVPEKSHSESGMVVSARMILL